MCCIANEFALAVEEFSFPLKVVFSLGVSLDNCHSCNTVVYNSNNIELAPFRLRLLTALSPWLSLAAFASTFHLSLN